jgi:putative sterol carrier protein
MNLAAATTHLRGKVGTDCGLGAVLKLDCGADGVIVVDARRIPNTVSNEAGMSADCTITLSLATLGALIAGSLAPMAAYLGGKFKVAGDMAVAMKLQRLV